MRIYWLLVFLWPQAGFTVPPTPSRTLARDVRTWGQRLAADPRRTGLEIAEFFVRLPAAEWRDEFAPELKIFDIVARGQRLPRPLINFRYRGRRRLGRAPRPTPALSEAARDSFAKAFLTAVRAEDPPALGELLEWLLKSEDEFWAERVVELFIEKGPLERKSMSRILPYVPNRLFTRVLRAIEKNQFDTMDAYIYAAALVLDQALRGKSLEITPSKDSYADLSCALMLAQAWALIEVVRSPKN